MSKCNELSEEITMLDNRIATYDKYLYMRNTGKLEVRDRLTEIDFPALEKKALEHYRHLLLVHWSLERKKEERDEQ